MSEHNIFYLNKDTDAADSAQIFHDIRKLAEAVNDRGRQSSAPITVYIAPGVYWVDDPYAEDTVQCQEGDSLPFGLKIACDSLHLVGCQDAPGKVVLAGNRGQSHGANGNYTMFEFRVRELTMEGLTIGNYCSMDLNYPWDLQQNQPRRTQAVTQAQLAWQQGDKLLARNCNFMGRLNLLPVCGGKRCLYEKCHFECTDDALNARGVYLDCDFDFYGSRPFYITRDSGAVFLHCLFRSKCLREGTESTQYFTKEGGQVTVVDCVYSGLTAQQAAEEEGKEAVLRTDWTKYPSPSLRCYQSRVYHNGEAVRIGGAESEHTVCMEQKEIEKAYRLETDEGVIYNTYNLLRGEDEWDPMQVKEQVRRSQAAAIPTRLVIEATGEKVQTGGESVSLEATAFYFDGRQAADEVIVFTVSEEDSAYVKLTPVSRSVCQVESILTQEASGRVVVHAITSQGLEAAVELTVCPSLLAAPVFCRKPWVELLEGSARLRYELQPREYKDRSEVSWYRCREADGSDGILVAVAHGKEILKSYPLTQADEGCYLMAKAVPCHARSVKGTAVAAVSDQKVSMQELSAREGETGERIYTTDFSTMPTKRQEKILPGFWTVDCYRPADTAAFGKWETDAQEGQSGCPWAYGMTGNGSVGQGLYQKVQGARLMYTPLEDVYTDMTLYVRLDPAKTAGQGFGSAGQYMDLCVKFDTASLTGYGVRILRPAEVSDGVRFVPVRYEEGKITSLNEGILTSCFLTGCEITLQAAGNILSIHARSQQLEAHPDRAKYAPTVEMSVEIVPQEYGGVAIQHTGTPGSGGWQNTTMLHQLTIRHVLGKKSNQAASKSKVAHKV